MDAMGELLEGAYKKLYRWIRMESKTFEEETADVPSLLIDAFAALQERPVLLKFVYIYLLSH